MFISLFCCIVFQLIGAFWHPIAFGPLQVEEVSVRLITVSVRLNTVSVRLNTVSVRLITVSVKLNTATKRENTNSYVIFLYFKLKNKTKNILPP